MTTMVEEDQKQEDSQPDTSDDIRMQFSDSTADKETKDTMEISREDSEKQDGHDEELASNEEPEESTEEAVAEEPDIEDDSGRKKALLDSPLIIEGKRQRQSVNRLTTTTPVTKKAAPEVSGSGTALGDIEFVNAAVSKCSTDALKSFHRLCYGFPGTATTRKKELRRFNGFSFRESSIEFEKKKAAAMKLSSSEIRSVRQMLGAETGHSKEEEVMNVLRFLLKPKDLGKKVPAGKKRRRPSVVKKGANKSKRSKTAKESTKKTKKEVSANEDNEENEDESSEESEASGEVDSENEAKKSHKKVEPKSKKSAPTPKRVGKIAIPTKKKDGKLHDKDPDEEKKVDFGENGPKVEEVDAAINELLGTVNLIDCTMKQMCLRVAEKLPNLNMELHKNALKSRVKLALKDLDEDEQK